MAHFVRKQVTEGPLKGQYEWVLTTTGSVTPEKLELTPQTVTLPRQKRFKCKLCSKTYSSEAIFANHFKFSHKEESKDKESWRIFVEDTKNG